MGGGGVIIPSDLYLPFKSVIDLSYTDDTNGSTTDFIYNISNIPYNGLIYITCSNDGATSLGYLHSSIIQLIISKIGYTNINITKVLGKNKSTIHAYISKDSNVKIIASMCGQSSLSNFRARLFYN